jgi:hypothetical protein
MRHLIRHARLSIQHRGSVPAIVTEIARNASAVIREDDELFTIVLTTALNKLVRDELKRFGENATNGEGLRAGQLEMFPRDARTFGHLAVLGAVNIAIPFWLIGWAEQHIDSGLAGILQSTAPFFTLVIAATFVHDERITRGRLAGITCVTSRPAAASAASAAPSQPRCITATQPLRPGCAPGPSAKCSASSSSSSPARSRPMRGSAS